MSDDRFDKLKYPIHTIPHGTDLLHEFKDLYKLKEFKSYSDPDRNYIIRYIIYLYDINSPLAKEFDKLSDRKDAAAIEAGWKRWQDGSWPKKVLKAIELRDPRITAMAIRYIRLFNDKAWTEMCILEQELERYYTMRFEGMTYFEEKETAKRTKSGYRTIWVLKKLNLKTLEELAKMCDSRQKRLEELKKEFFGDNGDLREAEKMLQFTTPENIDKVFEEYVS